MGWEDRSYYRDRSGSYVNPLLWVLAGSVPLFTAFGVRVRAHASLILLIVVVLVLGHKDNYPLQLRALTMGVLCVLVILHEFGHVFMARWVGGSANEVLLWPLGGLAFTDTPHRWGAKFLTVAAGPAVNLGICILCATGVRLLAHEWVSLDPFNPVGKLYFTPDTASYYLLYIFIVSYFMFLFNLLPIFPLDGGQMAQAALWPLVGHFRSMMIATTLGMTASVAVGIWMIFAGMYLTAVTMVWTFYASYRMRMDLRDNGPEDWQDSVDYHASIYGKEEQPKRKRPNRRAMMRARRIAQQETAARNRIDTILAKVSAKGMASLTWFERRTLRKTTERQRRREMELSQFQ